MNPAFVQEFPLFQPLSDTIPANVKQVENLYYEGVEMSIDLIKTWHSERFKSIFSTERRDPPYKK
ncbi:hypothetical protein J6TS7_48420 [Paenibacillus dendritiformis]|nr:hypothetical protein J6TS7_48420 [Paenibacillus dendritiformis]